MHFKDKNGKWQEISEEVRVNGTLFEMFQTNKPITIDASTGKSIFFIDPLNSIQFGSQSNVVVSSKGGEHKMFNSNLSENQSKLVGNQLVLKNFFPGIDRIQTLMNGALKSDYTIHHKIEGIEESEFLIFEDFYALPKGWRIEYGDGKHIENRFEGSLAIFDENNSQVGVISIPVFYDSFFSKEKSEYRGHSMKGTFELKKLEGKTRIRIFVPTNWLNASDRVYPVTIDPTISGSLPQYGNVNGYAYSAACQEQIIISVPSGNFVTSTSTTYSITAQNGGWRSEQISRVGVGSTWTANQINANNNAGTQNYSLTGLTIANGLCGNITFTWQAYRTWDTDGFSDCDQYNQYRSGNWVVNVDYSALSAPTSVGWTATGGTFTTPACGSNSATLCAGSGTGVLANLVQGVNYTVENLGTTACGTALTNAYMQAWSPGGTTCGFNPIGSVGLNAVTFNAPSTGSHRINVTSNSCGSAVNTCGGGVGHDFTGNSAVLRYRQNTTVNNTTSTANICLSGTKSLTATLGGAHNNPTVVWSVVSGSGSISGSTFTPSGTGPVVINATVGNCSSSVNFDVISSITPTFNSVAPICAGDPLSALPTTSTNGITGSWSPALDNTQTTLYTFTPSAGQCASTATMTITVNNITTPTFTSVSAICSGDALAPLPTTSTNGITGSWSPALDNSQTTVYTFTPNAGQCASTATMTITVTNNVTPLFNPVADVCEGSALAPLPTTSTNGVTGTWSPALDNTQTTLYTFTPNAGQCATSASLTITIIEDNLAVSSDVASVCPSETATITASGATSYVWSPATGLNQTTGSVVEATPSSTQTYTVVGTFNGCAFSENITITIKSIPTITAGPVGATLCAGNSISLSATGGVVYVWLPTAASGSTVSVSPLTSTVYTVLGTALNGCVGQTTLTVNVTTPPAATIAYAGSPFCSSIATAQSVTRTGTAGGVYSSTAGLSIDPSTGAINPSLSTPGNYVVTYTIAASGGCPVYTTTANITISPAPTGSFSYAGTPFCGDLSTSQPVTFTGTNGGTFSAPAGLTIDGTTGEVIPSSSTSGTYTVTYSIPAGLGCPAFSTTSTVTISTPPTGTLSYAGTPFCTSLSAPQAVTFVGTSGGTYSSTAGLTINPTTGAITPSSSTPGSYVVTYTIAAANGCPIFTATTSVQINALPTVSIAYAGSPYCGNLNTNQSVT
ncbi:MAG: hypothetical protein E6Q37_06765, partial [Crocinitomicaceae bacterium]